jgi:DNA-binding Lrp family transcriptional regulator
VSVDNLAAEMGISPSGLRRRIHALGLSPERGSRGRVVMTPELEATLREADRLMGDGAGTATVRRVLGISDTAPANDASAAYATDTEAVAHLGVSHDALEIREAVMQAIAQQTDLAERYARAAHRVGELEATVRAVEVDRDRIKAALDQAQARLDALSGSASSSRRPWWAWWC